MNFLNHRLQVNYRFSIISVTNKRLLTVKH